MTLPDDTLIGTDAIDLPTRVKSALIKNGFMTLGQLRTLPRSGPERFDWLTLPGVGLAAARDIECFLAALPPEPAKVRPHKADDWADYPRISTVRIDAAMSCLCWLIDNPSVETVLLVDTNGSGRLRHILNEDDILFLVQRWQDHEKEQACAAAERAQER